MSDHSPISIVIIDDDPLQLRLVEKHFQNAEPGCRPKRVLTFRDPAEAMAHLPVDGVTAIFCDYDMPDGSGVDWLPDLIAQDVGPVLLLTATGDEQVATRAFRCGVSDYLLKQEVMPDPTRLRRAAGDAVRRYKLQKRNRQAARELKLANLNLEDRNARLREMTDTAHRFVDNVAHEFRTPLTVIQEFASILRDGIGGPVTDEQRHYLDYIQAGVRDLSGLVDDFLDTSKLKARVLKVDRRATTIEQVFDGVRPICKARGQAKSIAVRYRGEAALPGVFCDAEKVGRVIVNLVVNAIKFSPQGATVEVGAEQDGADAVRLSVTDHGKGIPAQQLAGLCERFTQVGGNTADLDSGGKGFGLGLNIARDLVALNLGSMQITSTEGQGSVFSFTLPVSDDAAVLRHYAQTMGTAGVSARFAVLRLVPTHPRATGEQVRAFAAACCQSMDLVLCSEDGRSVVALGPTQEPRRWAERLASAWVTRGPEDIAKAPLSVHWLGDWPAQRLADQALPVVAGCLERERDCA